MGQSETSLTPVWCAYCKCYVPEEREPHVTPKNRLPHYAKDQPDDKLGNEPPPKREES